MFLSFDEFLVSLECELCVFADGIVRVGCLCRSLAIKPSSCQSIPGHLFIQMIETVALHSVREPQKFE